MFYSESSSGLEKIESLKTREWPNKDVRYLRFNVPIHQWTLHMKNKNVIVRLHEPMHFVNWGIGALNSEIAWTSKGTRTFLFYVIRVHICCRVLGFFFLFAHFHKRDVLLISNPSNRMEFEALITKSPRKGTLRGETSRSYRLPD